MRGWLLILTIWAGLAQAAPETSLRPETRSGKAPVLEPSGSMAQPARDKAATDAASQGRALAQSLRPELRPRKFRRIAREREKLRKRGAVCGDLAIQGDVVGQVKGSKNGCGVKNAVRIRAVSDVELSQNAIVDCNTAKALKTWLDDTAKPTFARKGGGLKRLRVAAHYACRTRNNLPGGRISEHGKGRAIDISAVRLRDGTLITVRNGWNGEQTGPLLRRLHKGACGPFGTVLGPESDRFHRDHFHFDTARYRSGTFCR